MKSLTTDFFNKGKKKGQRGWMVAKGNFCLWSRERGRRQFCESQSWSDRSVSLWETNHLDEEEKLMFIALNLVVRKQIFVCTVLLSLVLSRVLLQSSVLLAGNERSCRIISALIKSHSSSSGRWQSRLGCRNISARFYPLGISVKIQFFIPFSP